MLSHSSGAPGYTVGSASLQSSPTGTNRLGALQAFNAKFGSPWASRSMSSYQVGAPTAFSSLAPSQSLSLPSQTSIPPGCAVSSLSLQSPPTVAYWEGWLQATTVSFVRPYPSPSAPAASPPSTR